MMKTLVKFLFLTGLSLFVVCLVAPSFIDWNQHKAGVVARIAPYFTRKLNVAGNVSLRILPQPEIMLEDVTIAGPTDQSPPVISLKSLEMQIKLQPLLNGQIEVETINLTQPVLNFDILGGGKTSLSDVLTPKAKPGTAAQSVQLNKVSITGGTVNYTNQLTGSRRTFSNLDLAVTANTLMGPYAVDGSMEYQKSSVALKLKTEAPFDNTLSAPVHVSFVPASGLPQVTFGGNLSLQSGLDLEGEVGVANGNLSSLINLRTLDTLDFLRDPVDLKGTLVFKGDQFIVNDIKAKVGGKGQLNGRISLQFPQKGAPTLAADLDASNLTVTGKPSDSYPALPGGQGSLRLKGKNIVWNGQNIAAVDASVSFNDQVWTLKSVQAALPGETQVKIGGVVTPKTNTASYSSVQISTNDLGKMISALAPGDAGIFKFLNGAVKKMKLSSNVEVSPAKISFFNIDAVLDDKAKAAGVINVDRVTTRPAVAAKLHLTDWTDRTVPDAFTQNLMKSDADLELTAANFIKDDVKIETLSFKGKTGEKGLDITELNGTIAGGDTFTLTGHAAGFGPVSGLDGIYTLKTAHAATIAKSLSLPPLPVNAADLKGTITGDAGKYAYTAEGSVESLTLATLKIAHPALKLDAANPQAPKLSLSGGSLWSGSLAADITFSRLEGGGWSSTIKGSVTQADLHRAQEQLGFSKGLTLGTSDIAFDLASPDSTPKTAAGNLSLEAGTLKIDDFNVDTLADDLGRLKSLPDDLQGIVDDSVSRSGLSAFKNVHVAAKLIAGGKLTIDPVTLSSTGAKTILSGTVDLADKTYDLSGDLQLASPKDFPSLRVQGSTGKPFKAFSNKDLEDYVVKNLPPPPPAVLQPEVAPVPVPGSQIEEAPAAPPAADQPIGDILKRLDDDETPNAETPAGDDNDPTPLTGPDDN